MLSFMYIVSIKTAPGTSSVPVARLGDLDQAISFAFQLHQIASMKHYIVVECDNETLATFIRKESVTLPVPASSGTAPAPKKSVFGKKNS